jgi:hypothetical protein
VSGIHCASMCGPIPGRHRATSASGGGQEGRQSFVCSQIHNPQRPPPLKSPEFELQWPALGYIVKYVSILHFSFQCIDTTCSQFRRTETRHQNKWSICWDYLRHSCFDAKLIISFSPYVVITRHPSIPPRRYYHSST